MSNQDSFEDDSASDDYIIDCTDADEFFSSIPPRRWQKCIVRVPNVTGIGEISISKWVK